MQPSEEYLLGYASNLDHFAHEWNAELTEKYSLFLVFATFIFGLALQLGYLSIPLGWPHGRLVIVFDGLAVGFSLLSLILLLATATIGGYKMTPLPSECMRYVAEQREFLGGSVDTDKDVDVEKETLDGLKAQLLSVLQITVADNVRMNEWKTMGLFAASISLLGASICFATSVVLFAISCLSA